jgi:lysophospholipase L1-like esterase
MRTLTKYPLFLFVLLLFMNCRGDAPSPAAPVPENGLRYLALGDSYTIGQSVADAERFPVQLAAALEQRGVTLAEPRIIAATGWTTTDLKNALAAASLENQAFDLVSLLIGVNNQYQGRSLAGYKREFTELLLQSIRLARGDKERVLVLSIPDWGYTPFGQSRQEAISAEIDSFNAVNRQVTDSLGVPYLDITPISRQGLSEPGLVASDGLHPSGRMYGQWVALMVEEVLQKVRQP